MLCNILLLDVKRSWMHFTQEKKEKKNIVNLILLILNLETPLTYLTL